MLNHLIFTFIITEIIIVINIVRLVINLTMEKPEITYRDLYIQIRNMKLQHPDKFLAIALPLFPINSFKALRVNLFYVGCFIWHYPASFIPIIIISLKVFKNKIVNGIYEWKRRLDIYSPQAQEARHKFQQAYDRMEFSDE